MMTCDEVRELLGDYWDMPEGDGQRSRVDEHVKRCSSCAEEFAVWRESALLIQSAARQGEPEPSEKGSLSVSVMNRIYADESWRVPIAERLYAIPHRLRVRLTAIISACLAMFGCAFLYYLIFPTSTQPGYVPTAGLMSVGSLGGSENIEFSIAGVEGVPVASVGDPVILGLPMVDSYPDYLLVVSMLGLIGALLIMNWFASIRA